MDTVNSEKTSQTPTDNHEQVFYPLEVSKVIQDTVDACSVVLKISPQLKQKFAYRAGQYLTFEIPWGDFSIRRSYSLCSAPSSGEDPTVTIKRVTDGRASNWFNDQVKPGMSILVAPPAGRFSIRNDNTNPIVLAAGGSGITPIISIIKTVLLESSRELVLIYANRDPQSVIFHDQINALAQQHPDRLTCHYHLDSEGSYLGEEKLLRLIDDRWDADFYVCGPGPYMDLVENTLLKRDVKKTNIFIERFVSPIDPDRTTETTEAANDAEISTPSNVEFSVTLDGVETNIPYQPGTTLLDNMLACSALEEVPHSCCEGHCGSCMAVLKKGDVKMLSNRILSKRDLAAGYVLACQSVPLTEEILLNFDE